jgi:hypothetical protein
MAMAFLQILGCASAESEYVQLQIDRKGNWMLLGDGTSEGKRLLLATANAPENGPRDNVVDGHREGAMRLLNSK